MRRGNLFEAHSYCQDAVNHCTGLSSFRFIGGQDAGDRRQHHMSGSQKSPSYDVFCNQATQR